MKKFFLITAFIIILIATLFGGTILLGEQSINKNLPNLTSSPNATPSNAPTTSSSVSTFTPAPVELSIDEYTAEAHRLFDLAFQEIEQLRNVTLPRVGLQVVSKDWAVQRWGVSIANADLKGITRQENIYKALLMIPQNASLYQATVDWAGHFMAVVQTGTVYLVQENFNITNTADAHATLVHELTHILQTAHNIPQYYYGFDGGKARTALTEGDATFTASYIKNQTVRNALPNLQPVYFVQTDFSTNNDVISAAFFPAIPDSIYNLDYFPYTYGEKFIQSLYNHGGWQAINNAYKNPPNSTEQILHSEKYFAAELPLTIDSVEPTEGNWTRTYSTQYGEFFIQNMLSTNLTRSDAEKAAAGWGADKLIYYEDNEQYLISWVIKWDTYNDAGEFFLAFNNYMNNVSANPAQFSQWQTGQVHQKISWNQEANSTHIIASTNPQAFTQFPN